MNDGSKAATYAAMRSGVSRNGSTLTKTTSGTSSGASSRSRSATDASTCIVIGQTSGQFVKPKKSSVNRPSSDDFVNGRPSTSVNVNSGSGRPAGSTVAFSVSAHGTAAAR